jgi:hypothetical protein
MVGAVAADTSRTSDAPCAEHTREMSGYESPNPGVERWRRAASSGLWQQHDDGDRECQHSCGSTTDGDREREYFCASTSNRDAGRKDRG